MPDDSAVIEPMQAGLVCGYSVSTSGEMTRVTWGSMDQVLAAEDTLVWLHFDQSDAAARNWIAGCSQIPETARAILLGSDQHMRLQAAGPGLAGVVGDLHHEFAQKPDRLDVLRLYLDTRHLISARREPLAAIEKLRNSIGEGLRVDRPIALVTQFLHHLTDTLADVILELADNVDTLEETVLSASAAQPGEELSRIRRVAARLRRHMIPQQHALIGLLSRLPSWIVEADAANLRNAIERLGALGHDLDLVQERARLLQEQASNRLMEATNRNLYILSVVTTIFLPITLITGVFGMNLGGLPGQQAPYGFWFGLGLMGIVVIGTLYLLRRGRMV
jgi:zinc transporter